MTKEFLTVGAPGWTPTSSLSLRRRLLYAVELQGQFLYKLYCFVIMFSRKNNRLFVIEHYFEEVIRLR